MRFTIETNLDAHTRAMLKLLSNKAKFVKLWANSAAIEARQNARAKGGRTFWPELARSIQVKNISNQEVHVSTAKRGATIKQFGGTIRPVRKSALTVPLKPESYGKTVYELDRPNRPLFRVGKALGYSSKSGEFVGLFALVKSTKQRPDPWFPDNARLNFLARREIEYLYKKNK